MKNSIKISIIVPVYNVSKYIERCIISIQQQTYTGDMECIFVDDCTEDDSCIVIEKFWKNYRGNIDWKIIHHSRNRGLSAARNTGIDASTGSYVYFLDSDDAISYNCIEKLVHPLLDKEFDMVVGDYEVVGSLKEYPPLYLDEGSIIGNKEAMIAFFTGKYYMMAWNKLYNVKFLRKEKIRFCEGLIHEDDLWSFCLACQMNSIYIVKEKVYKYYIRENSITTDGKSMQKHMDAYVMVLAEKWKWCCEHRYENVPVIFRQIYFNAHYAVLWRCLDNACDYKKCYMQVRSIFGSPITYWRKKLISTMELIREIHYLFPLTLGRKIHYIDYKIAHLRK